jgi:hypothetical protein
VVVDTRDHAATFNAAIRDRLVAAGAVDDHRAAVTADGQRIGAGDAVVTRRNDPTLGVANRETWMVTRVHRDGRLTVHDRDRGTASCPPTTSATTCSSATPPPATVRRATPPRPRTS